MLLLYKTQNTLAVRLRQCCASNNHSEEAPSGVNKAFNLLCAALLENLMVLLENSVTVLLMGIITKQQRTSINTADKHI